MKRATVTHAPILFLDFDGVLHPGSGQEGNAFSCASLLDQALERSEVDIVISSSWRFHASLEHIVGWLPQGLSRRVVGVTGDAFIGRWARHQEILAWVERHRRGADWRALDDATIEFPEACKQLIACSPRIGFSEREARVLRAWLQESGSMSRNYP